MAKRVSIKDIAKRAGVSAGTVDRVLHNRGNVSSKARQLVENAMKDLKYKRNLIASSLAYNKIWRVAVLIPQPHKRSEGFWEQVNSGIRWASEVVHDYGVEVDAFRFDDSDASHFISQTHKIFEDNYHAVLVASVLYEETKHFFDLCVQHHLKYCQINTYIERNDDEFLFYLGQDSYHSGFLAAKLLDFGLEPGSTAMILHLERSIYNAAHLIEKEKGFEDYFKSHTDINTAKAIFYQIHQKVDFEKFITYQLRSYPDLKGIFVTTARVHHLVPILEKLGRTDIKLVGFDLTPKNLEYLQSEKIDFLINQNPIKQGYMGVLNIMNYLVLKQSLSQIQHLPLDIVVKENVQYYIEQKEKLYLPV